MRLLACLCVCAALSGCLEAPRSSRPIATLRQMQDQLMGRDKEQVRSMLGDPHIVQEREDSVEWTYSSAYCHPDAPTAPKWLYVVFRDDRVIRVR